MRLLLGMLILTNVIVSILYCVIISGSTKEMFKYNLIWTITYSLLWFGGWLIDPYIR